MNKETDSFEGTIQCVGEISTIQRKDKKPFDKRLIGVQKDDGQLAFFESRKQLDMELPIGTRVVMHYYWAGSIKNEKMYNNIIVTHIQIVK